MTNQERQNESVAKHIWHDILQCSFIPFSWNFEVKSIKTELNGTSFRVNTKLVIGWVKIEMDITTKNFTVTIQPDNYKGPIVFEHVLPQELVSKINRVLKKGETVENNKSDGRKVAA